MAISKHKDQYKVILQIPEPAQHTKKSRIVSATGKTISQAVDVISMDMESGVDLLHLKLIMFDKPFAEQGMEDAISSFMRSRDVSSKALVVVCDEDFDHFFSNMKTFAFEGISLFDFF